MQLPDGAALAVVLTSAEQANMNCARGWILAALSCSFRPVCGNWVPFFVPLRVGVAWLENLKTAILQTRRCSSDRTIADMAFSCAFSCVRGADTDADIGLPDADTSLFTFEVGNNTVGTVGWGDQHELIAGPSTPAAYTHTLTVRLGFSTFQVTVRTQRRSAGAPGRQAGRHPQRMRYPRRTRTARRGAPPSPRGRPAPPPCSSDPPVEVHARLLPHPAAPQCPRCERPPHHGHRRLLRRLRRALEEAVHGPVPGERGGAGWPRRAAGADAREARVRVHGVGAYTTHGPPPADTGRQGRRVHNIEPNREAGDQPCSPFLRCFFNTSILAPAPR